MLNIIVDILWIEVLTHREDESEVIDDIYCIYSTSIRTFTIYYVNTVHLNAWGYLSLRFRYLVLWFTFACPLQ